MRILIVGGNLAGLLSAQQLHRNGDEVSILVHGQEASVKPGPPMVFTDHGPWISRQSTWTTLAELISANGDVRIGQHGYEQLPWLMRWLWQRTGSRARKQSARALALVRRSKLLFDELHATGCLSAAAESMQQVNVYESAAVAKAHYQSGPIWHMGSSRPSLCPLHEHLELLPALDVHWARSKPTLISGGMTVRNSSNVMAALCLHLSRIGVRFIHNHTVAGIERVANHLHAVRLLSKEGMVEEIDTDLVVATSFPAAWPLLRTLGLDPDLASVKSFGLRALISDTATKPLLIHDKLRGTRLIRHGNEVWAQSPAWLGEAESKGTSEVAHLTAEISRYFGPNHRLVSEAPVAQTSWIAPDGLPMISRTRVRNLFLNIGHYSTTATMAFGAANILQALLDKALNINRSTTTNPMWSPFIPTTSNTLSQIYE